MGKKILLCWLTKGRQVTHKKWIGGIYHTLVTKLEGSGGRGWYLFAYMPCARRHVVHVKLISPENIFARFWRNGTISVQNYGCIIGKIYILNKKNIMKKKRYWSFSRMEQIFQWITVISVNSGNLINYWSINWVQFKDPVSHMCLSGAVVASCSLTQEVWALLMTNIFCHWIHWKHLGYQWPYKNGWCLSKKYRIDQFSVANHKTIQLYFNFIDVYIVFFR